MTKSRGIQHCRLVWSEEEAQQLRALYPDTRTDQIAAALGRTVQQIYAKADGLGLKKSAAYLASPDACRLRRGGGIGTATRFQPGQVAHNKGKTMQTVGRMAETQFKPGHRGGRALENYQPIGAERISKDGYRQRKINDDLPIYKRWRAVHILLWEAEHGPLPAGHALAFRNGDKADMRLDNLELLLRRELMARNTVHNYPKPVAELMQLRGALVRQINARKKRDERHTEHD